MLDRTIFSSRNESALTCSCKSSKEKKPQPQKLGVNPLGLLHNVDGLIEEGGSRVGGLSCIESGQSHLHLAGGSLLDAASDRDRARVTEKRAVLKSR